MYLASLKSISKLIFLDIETAGLAANYAELSEGLKPWWHRKATQIAPEETEEEAFVNRSAIYAEFARVVCVGLGVLSEQEGGWSLRTKVIHHTNEKEILTELAELLAKRPGVVLVAHNGKEFDFPVLARRMLVNGVTLPDALRLSGKKPWDVPHIDTMDAWKFGDRKSYTPLGLLAEILGCHSSKNDMDGSQVHGLFYAGETQKIINYCADDIVLLTEVFLHLNGTPFTFSTTHTHSL